MGTIQTVTQMDEPASLFRSDLPLEAKLETARTELLDLSARNRLLNTPRSSKSSRIIEITDEKSTEIFRLLVREEKAFTFSAGRSSSKSSAKNILETEEEQDEIIDLAQPEDESVDARGFPKRHADTNLQTRLTSKGLQKRLLELYSDSITLEQEQGVNILFLAMGMLRWIDPKNAVNIRYAPLILIPASLERTTAADKFKLKWRHEEQAANLSLEAYLEREHLIRLPHFESGEEFEPAIYMAAVAESIASKPGWEVLPDDMVVGFFSFSKFLMYRDLDPECWPAEASLASQPLIRSLLTDGFPYVQDAIPPETQIDAYIHAQDLLHVADSDSSQSVAVHEARIGRNLVIQGPPGTGKSQTIANIIATAIADGKTVLFVAEKMVALGVVKNRLDRAGVGDACLELHSNKANKRLLLDELRRTWNLGSPRGEFPSTLNANLQQETDALNLHAAALHQEHPVARLTPYQVIGELTTLVRLGRVPVDFELCGVDAWTPDDRQQREGVLDEFAQRVLELGIPDQHPWAGIGLNALLPTDVERLMRRIHETRVDLEYLSTESETLARILSMPVPEATRDLAKIASLARRLAEAPDLTAAAFTSADWHDPGRQVELESLLHDGAHAAALTQQLAAALQPEAWNVSVGQMEHDAQLMTGFLPFFSAQPEAGSTLQRTVSLLAELLLQAGKLQQQLSIAAYRVVGRFAALDRERIAASAFEVVHSHHRRIPPASGIGPVGILRGEIAKKTRHLPIRQLMQKAAPAVQALKPVLMMSPLSVAQFLPPGKLSFDLLVMDEASQIQPVDALGAIARCRQVIVVGDERQLPPTRFFAKMTSDVGDANEEEEDPTRVGDIESILGLFIARGLPQRMLRWHYRSRHQSLIAVSNSEFYENRLFIIPSPFTAEAGMGLRFHFVENGIFYSESKSTEAQFANPVEARAVAEGVIRHATEHPDLTLGVATFSMKQRRAIQDQLEVLRRLNPDTEAFFHGHHTEPFFIKNLENVQGDERDVILISVGYGRDAQGNFAMRFGPLGMEGGERRLNVLISRAKQRCEVFASITDEDIDTERAKGKGIFALKLFLHFARTGSLDMTQSLKTEPSKNTFASLVAAALQQRGYQVLPRVGIAGCFLDLAIVDPDAPGRYVLGIECDGPSYKDARSARDRDRLRKAVLEDHGWLLHRVWSIDWLHRPQEQLDRLVQRIEEAKTQLATEQDEATQRGKARLEIFTVERDGQVEMGLSTSAIAQPASAPYIEAVLPRPTQVEFHETPTGLLADLVHQIVQIEGPIYSDEVIVRLRTIYGLQRSGPRIQLAAERAIAASIQSGSLLREGNILSIPGIIPKVRDRSQVSTPGLRKPELLPSQEIQTAILELVTESFGATQDEIVRGVSRKFGYASTGKQLRSVICGALADLELRSSVVKRGELHILASQAAQ